MFNPLSSLPFFFNPGVTHQSDTLQNPISGSPASYSPVDNSPGAVAPTHQSYSLSERFSRDDSFAISIMTQDGDQVEITFNSETSYKSDYSSHSSGGRESQRYSIDKDQSSEFGFSVEGNLDVEELDAIAALVQDLSSLAANFFNGDLQTAMQQAGDLSFDSEQLSEMEISMQQSIEYRAIEKYREVQSIGDAAPAVSQNALSPFIEQLQNQLSISEQIVANASEFSMSLFVNLVQHDVRFTSSSEPRQNSLQESITRLSDMVHNRQDRHDHKHDSGGLKAGHEHENRSQRSDYNQAVAPAADPVAGTPLVDTDPVAETA